MLTAARSAPRFYTTRVIRAGSGLSAIGAIADMNSSGKVAMGQHRTQLRSAIAIRRPELLAGALRSDRIADQGVQFDSYNIFPLLIGRRGPPFTRSNALPTSAFRNSIISGSALQIVLRS